MFKFFNIKKETRKAALEPQHKKAWITHMLSELIGSIWISMGLAGLSIFISGRELEKYFLFNNVLIGFFAGFIIVGSCLIIFGRWSVDLNPAVTLYRWIAGTNTSKYAFIKILFQILGGIIAGLIIYALGHNFGSSSEIPKNNNLNDPIWKANHFANSWISAVNVTNKTTTFFPHNHIDIIKETNTNKLIPGALLILFGELVLTSILLFPIFSPKIDNKYRDLFILLIISFDVWMGILLGSAAINAIRGFAQQAPTLFFNMSDLTKFQKTDIIVATMMMILGDILAPFFYALMQGFTEKYFNNWLVKAINYKNNRFQDYIKKN